MKIIATRLNYLAENNQEPIFSVWPDSMILKNNEPFYIPNFSKKIEASAAILLKISKHGKAFAPKFAHRYYSQIGTAIHFVASDLYTKLLDNKLSTDIAVVFDQSLSVSLFSEIGNISLKPEYYTYTFNSNKIEINLSDFFSMINILLSKASQYFTFKIGDLFYIELSRIASVKIGDSIEVGFDKQYTHICEIK